MTDKPQLKVFHYITVVPGRTPEQKSHPRLGDAKSALIQYPKAGFRNAYDSGKYLVNSVTGHRKYVKRVCGGQLWEVQDGEPVLLHDIPTNTWEHELPWKVDEYKGYA